MGHDSTTLHTKTRFHVIRGEPVIKKRKLSKVTISSEPTTSESFDNESISNSQYIYTTEAIHNESVLTQMLVPKLQVCNLQKSAFQFLKWYVLFEHPTTAQIHVGIFNNLK
jgi:hypothetical protein